MLTAKLGQYLDLFASICNEGDAPKDVANDDNWVHFECCEAIETQYRFISPVLGNKFETEDVLHMVCEEVFTPTTVTKTIKEEIKSGANFQFKGTATEATPILEVMLPLRPGGI